MYYIIIIQELFSSHLTTESQLIAPRRQWTFENLSFAS